MPQQRLPLLPLQRRLWFLQQLDLNGQDNWEVEGQEGGTVANTTTSGAYTGSKAVKNTNAFGQKMAALACAPSPHYASVFDHNKRWRDYLSSYYRSFGFEVPQSHANFITPQFFEASLTEDYKAYLESHDIRVLSLKGWNLPTRLRISLGSDEALEALMGSTEIFMSTLKMAA